MLFLVCFLAGITPSDPLDWFVGFYQGCDPSHLGFLNFAFADS